MLKSKVAFVIEEQNTTTITITVLIIKTAFAAAYLQKGYVTTNLSTKRVPAPVVAFSTT